MSALGNKKVFSENLRRYMALYEKNRNDICNDLGFAYTTFTSWETGINYPRIDKIEMLANYFGIEKSDLIENKSQEESPTRHAKGTRIPVLGRVAAGIPIEAITDIDEWEEIPESMAKTGEYFALRIQGDSMLPEIRQGDIVIVHKQPCVESGEIAIVLVNGNDATCKKIQKQESGITLIGYNTAVYSPTFYTLKQIEDLPVRVLGKVIEVRRKL